MLLRPAIYLPIILLLISSTIAIEFPKVTLPWGTWQATRYDEEGDFFTFENVRFGKAPVGELRFQKSAFPDQLDDPSELQPSEGSACFQYQPPGCLKAHVVAEKAAHVLAEESSDLPRYGLLLPGKPPEVAEDCLFADLYVPASALANSSQLPVVVWLYGGAFTFGAKDAGFGAGMPFYNATGLLRTAHDAHQDFVFVAGNYRLGAFGWLAGPTMERYGAPNAGLWDQRLLLAFVHEHISLFGGDPDSVALWGESAGAGSILHHLTSTERPLFNRVLAQSPAYLQNWDRSSKGYAARIFRNLTREAGCPTTGEASISCLQALKAEDLQHYNKAIIRGEWLETGLIAFNPAVDGSLIEYLPNTAFQQGHFWTNVSSLIVSHVADESKSFVPCYIKTDDDFDRFLNDFIPFRQYPDQIAAIKEQYERVSKPYQRAHDVIQDSSFICNTRAVFDAYNDSSSLYMMQYAFMAQWGAAVHAADLLPTFFNNDVSEDKFVKYLQNVTDSWSITAKFFYSETKSLAAEFQPYLASFAAFGIPAPASSNLPEWKPASVNDNGELTRVIQTGWGARSDITAETTDRQNSEMICGFWRNMSAWLELTAAATDHSRTQSVVDKVDL